MQRSLMTQGQTNACNCGGSAEIVADLVERDLLEMKTGERLWKLFCFRDTSHPTSLRHRIYTKQKADGRLALLTFAVHNPVREATDAAPVQPVRSALARVPDLSPADLDKLIEAMRTRVRSDACEELDLTQHSGLDEQLAWLHAQAK